MAARAVAFPHDRPPRGPARRSGGGIVGTVLGTLALGVHVLALLGGGGLAVAFDRGTLRARSSSDAARAHHLAELRLVHRLVGAALAASVVSGLALFARHVNAYVTSPVFWVKMALVVALSANALVMQIAERGLREDADPAAWPRLRACARASTTLWFAVAASGAILAGIGGQR